MLTLMFCRGIKQQVWCASGLQDGLGEIHYGLVLAVHLRIPDLLEGPLGISFSNLQTALIIDKT